MKRYVAAVYNSEPLSAKMAPSELQPLRSLDRSLHNLPITTSTRPVLPAAAGIRQFYTGAES